MLCYELLHCRIEKRMTFARARHSDNKRRPIHRKFVDISGVSFTLVRKLILPIDRSRGFDQFSGLLKPVSQPFVLIQRAIRRQVKPRNPATITEDAHGTDERPENIQ